MADTYEYVDKSGSLHRVDSLDQVPKEYLRTMTVTGGEDEPPAGAHPGSTSARPKGQDFGLPKGFEGVNPHLLVGALTVALMYKFKNFLVRCVIGVLAFVYFFMMGYSAFETSRLSQPGKKNRPAPVAPPQAED